jgi:2,3-bisphosphoglycerate-dependent phosphoglycerate mutase
MKIILSFLFALFLLTAASGDVSAQNKKLTIILLRHAEKDLSDGGAENPDPVLSEEGRQRAERLVETIKKYKPRAIYSSNFKRTRSTVTPLADKTVRGYRLPIQLYNHRNLNEFVERLLASNAKTIVVAGHNTTTPALANLLIKQDKYKPLAETEYDKIWIIEIKKGKAKDKITVY